MVQLSCSLLKAGVNVRRPTRGVQSAECKKWFVALLMEFGWRGLLKEPLAKISGLFFKCELA